MQTSAFIEVLFTTEKKTQFGKHKSLFHYKNFIVIFLQPWLPTQKKKSLINIRQPTTVLVWWRCFNISPYLMVLGFEKMVPGFRTAVVCNHYHFFDCTHHLPLCTPFAIVYIICFVIFILLFIPKLFLFLLNLRPSRVGFRWK